MSMIITNECINCGACAIECLEHAIFFAEDHAFFKNLWFEPPSTEQYFIFPDLCNECSGIEETGCITVCPMNSIFQTKD